MDWMQGRVRQFHRAMGLTVNDSPTWPSVGEQGLRVDLIDEEAEEFVRAVRDHDMVDVADALADLLYVVYGAAATFGIDIQPVFDEVHRSNMAKVGGRRREDGKILKPEGWQPPDIAPILKRQGWSERAADGEDQNEEVDTDVRHQ